MTARNVYEPLAVKENIVNGATEVASMILRIDDVIAASKSQTPAGPSGGGVVWVEVMVVETMAEICE